MIIELFRTRESRINAHYKISLPLPESLVVKKKNAFLNVLSF